MATAEKLSTQSKKPKTRSPSVKAGGAKRTTRRERVESKEGAIIHAAYQMFGKKGFAKSTITEIAKAAGVAEGTVYLYFKNKEALAAAIIAQFYERMTNAAREGVDQLTTTPEKLTFLANLHLQTVIEERRILELLSVLDREPNSKGGSAVHGLNKRYVAIFDTVVRDGVWRGNIEAGMTPWIVRDIFYGSLDYAMRTILLTGRQSEMEKFTRELVHLVMARAKLSGENSNGDRIDPQFRLTKLADRIEKIAERMDQTLAADVSAKPTQLTKRAASKATSKAASKNVGKSGKRQPN